MAYTHEEALAYWKTQNPYPQTVCDPECRETTPEEYEAMAEDRAAILVAESIQQDAHEADQAEKAGIVEKGQWLEETAIKLEDTSQTMTTQQLRNVLAETQRILADVIRYLNKQSKQPVEGTP